MKSRSFTALLPARCAKKNRTPNKIAAAKSGATAQTTTALVSRDATAASHAVEKRATTTKSAADAAMALTQLRNTEVKPQDSSVSPAARMRSTKDMLI